MSVVLDLIGSSILVGTLILSILGVNVTMNTESWKSASEFHTQTEAVQLARIFEFDMYKMGYDYTPPAGRHKIAIADTGSLKFYANLRNISGEVDSVQYQLGGLNSWSVNPRDRVLTRWENTSTVLINYSITGFKLTYYNSNNVKLSTPVTGSNLDSIRSVQVYLTMESPQPFGSDSSTSYAEGFYQKLIFPRNL